MRASWPSVESIGSMSCAAFPCCIMTGKDIVKAGYDAIAAKYLEIRAEDAEDVRLLEDLERRLPHGSRVLDAGCGAGVPVTRRLSRSSNVIGVDISKKQVELARRLVLQAQFICADMTTLTFPDHTFDAICSYYAIIHVPREEHRGLLLNFHRMLKPEGLLLVCLGADDLPHDVNPDYFGTTMYWSHYDKETNLRMLEECGFDVTWSKIVADWSSPGSAHLFVLAQRNATIIRKPFVDPGKEIPRS